MPAFVGVIIIAAKVTFSRDWGLPRASGHSRPLPAGVRSEGSFQQKMAKGSTLCQLIVPNKVSACGKRPSRYQVGPPVSGLLLSGLKDAEVQHRVPHRLRRVLDAGRLDLRRRKKKKTTVIRPTEWLFVLMKLEQFLGFYVLGYAVV